MRITILGTAGARYVVAKQLRASAGTVLEQGDYRILLDPGPGTLVYLAKHKIAPEKIKAILLSHKHLDHSADLNALVDAVTEGGFKKRGRLFLPQESLDEGILFPYLIKALKELVVLQAKTLYQEGPFQFATTSRLNHSTENYGFVFTLPNEKRLAFLTDTAYFEGLKEELLGVNYLIVNTVRYEPKVGVLHLSVGEVRELILEVKPELTILTHFGMTMLRANPFQVAKALSDELNLKVIAAYDGMKLNFEDR